MGCSESKTDNQSNKGQKPKDNKNKNDKKNDG